MSRLRQCRAWASAVGVSAGAGLLVLCWWVDRHWVRGLPSARLPWPAGLEPATGCRGSARGSWRAFMFALARRARRRGRVVTTPTLDVELLYTDGCPNAEAYLPRLRSLLAAEGIDTPMRQRIMTSDDQARREQFLGSPTVRVNGRDVEPDAEQRHDYGLSCRLYTGPDGIGGTPADEWVSSTLRGADRDRSGHGRHRGDRRRANGDAQV